jgi:hypothetical protein
MPALAASDECDEWLHLLEDRDPEQGEEEVVVDLVSLSPNLCHFYIGHDLLERGCTFFRSLHVHSPQLLSDTNES